MQRNLLQVACVAFMTTSVATTAMAQGRGRAAADYPPGFRPPSGMCRVWIQGRAPGQQPGVTDCITARASAPANARVIYGDRNDDPTYRGRTGAYTRTAYDANGNRVLQRVRRNADGTLSLLSSHVYTGTGSSVWSGKRNTNDCNGADQARGKHGTWKAKCKDGGEDNQGEENRGKDGKGSHGNGKGHGEHG